MNRDLVALLLYVRVILYPACAFGFMLLAAFLYYPEDRRRVVRGTIALYVSLAFMFAALGVVALTRITAPETIGALDLISTPPLILLSIVLAINIRTTSTRV